MCELYIHPTECPAHILEREKITEQMSVFLCFYVFMSECFDFHEQRSLLNSSFLFLAASCERNAASRFQSADAAEA